jgi:hypothetical protein
MLPKSLVTVVLGALLCTPVLAESADYRLPEENIDAYQKKSHRSLDRQVENLRACIDNLNHNRSGLMEFLAQYED